jgi:ribulose 1,5-bisphosphate synthetase/thiazole synthase
MGVMSHERKGDEDFTCDVAIVGAGTSGLVAAIAATEKVANSWRYL